jgi:hypothetical protein
MELNCFELFTQNDLYPTESLQFFILELKNRILAAMKVRFIV